MDGKNDNSSWDLLADALVEILVRVPPNARRQLRLVCRHWRELIDQVTDMRSRTKIIADRDIGLMSVVDLLTPGNPRRLLWQTDMDTATRYSRMRIVGTCNGLVCLCDDLTPGGAITVANPSTGEATRLPPLPVPSDDVHVNKNTSSRRWHRTYIFAYHHVTRRYKVVHVPCHLDPFWQPDVVHVFTLGETSWRDVHTGTDARCSLAEVDGTVYWLMPDARKIMAFDLKHERVTCTEPLATVPATRSTYSLTKVHGRLGVAVSGDDYSVTVWVLEGERWSRRYVLELRQQEKRRMAWRELVVPHLVLGDYFLTLTYESWSRHFTLCRHTVSETSRSQDGVVQIRLNDHGNEVTSFGSFIRTFSYIETKESLTGNNNVILAHN